MTESVGPLAGNVQAHVVYYVNAFLITKQGSQTLIKPKKDYTTAKLMPMSITSPWGASVAPE